ncbi:unnamed protein product [Brachionus calyciflorus]|uniref:NADH dehydrogenase [ubiquinone] 1 beta subcomplex subunit 9 n=1 Tax=Brachionus calyciflorus TaxID=104777 RepID=A0A814F3C8_9BILA|nr:unnamed protein product [Brachionus calyciflorus]
MSYLQTSILTHRQRVLRLYKAAVKNERSWFSDRDEWRFRATVLRDRFEKNRNIQDLVKAQSILSKGEQELDQNRHPNPLQFPNCPGGVAYGREPRSPDWVLDTWHPMEKSQFPDYFSKRMALKKDYIDWYTKKYGITKYNPEEEGRPHAIHNIDAHH